MIQVVEASHKRDYVLWLKFSDGLEGEIDLATELDGEIFEPLRDLEVFKDFSIHPELGTVAWSNGADFAPEFLYDRVRVHASTR